MYSWLFSTNSLPLQKNEVNKRSQKCNFIVKEKQKNEVLTKDCHTIDKWLDHVYVDTAIKCDRI